MQYLGRAAAGQSLQVERRRRVAVKIFSIRSNVAVEAAHENETKTRCA